MYNNIKFILGKAGTGKTTSTLTTLKGKSVMCLAYTHSAVENLRSKSNNEFKYNTIHKFLKLPINKIIHRALKKYEIFDYYVIDEISLIPLDIIEILFNLAIKRTQSKFIFIGDLLQLPSINKDKKIIHFNKYTFKNPINLNIEECKKLLLYLNDTIYFNETFIKSNKMILTHNYRNNEHVQYIINDILTNPENIKKYLIKVEDLKNYKSCDYVYLASRYKYLKTLYNITKIKNDDEIIVECKIGEIFIKAGDILIANENIEDMNLVNGEEYKIETVNPISDILLFNMKKFLPYNYITIHKSQGKTLNKILLCVDDLFEISMLYTALTRAKTDIKIICLGDINKEITKLKNNNKLFNILNGLLYTDS